MAKFKFYATRCGTYNGKYYNIGDMLASDTEKVPSFFAQRGVKRQSRSANLDRIDVSKLPFDKKIDYYCPQKNYLEHAMPTWLAMPDEMRGTIYIESKMAQHAKELYGDIPNVYVYLSVSELKHHLATKNRYMVCFAYHNCVQLSNFRKMILAEHGCGLTYDYPNSQYAGWVRNYDPQHMAHFLTTNKLLDQAHAQKNTGIPSTIVGMPVMDKYDKQKFKRNSKPVIAISCHWDCDHIPETRSSFSFFKQAFVELSRHYKVIGHAHPQYQKVMFPFWKKHGIEIVETFDEVLERADVYVCDNSSTIFQFAYVDKPVVLLNPPWYRTYFTHSFNPRFWSHADIGVNVFDPYDLLPAIEKAVQDDSTQKKARKRAVEDVFANKGHATQAFIKAIMDVLK